MKSFQEKHKMIALNEQTLATIEAAAVLKAQMLANEVKLGELSENSSREVTQKIYSGKKIKARLCDFRPSFLGGYKGTPEVMISIWEN